MNLLNLVNGNARGVQPQRAIAALMISALLVQPLMAQATRAGATEALQPAVVTDINAMMAGMPASALLAVDQNRSSIIETIVNQWRSELGADATVNELRTSLSALRADNLLAASNARTLDGLKKIFAASDAISKATANTKADGQKALGNLVADTTYTPITPCKLVDTRNPGTGYSYANGGAFAASEKRTYNSFSFCGPTVANMAAIQVSAVTQYTGAGGGILSMMANGAAPPITNIFYSGYAPVTTTIPVNGTSPGGLFDVQISGVAGAHMIIEVVGYFAAPTPTALQCVEVPVTAVASTWGIATAKSVDFPACTSGYTRTGVSCGYTGNAPAGILLQEGSASFGYCQWFNNSGVVQTTNVPNLQAVSTCCRVPGR